MEKSLKDQMENVLAVEREKNNAALTPVKKGIPTPDDVRKAKIGYIERRKSEGVPVAKAAKEAGISWHSFYAWKRQLAGKPSYKKVARQKKGLVVKSRHTYTESQRMELVHKLKRLLKQGLSQAEAGKKLGLSQGTASRWLLGQVPLSGLDRMRRAHPKARDNGEAKPVKVVRKESRKSEYISITEAMTAYRKAGNPDDFEKELLRAIIRRA